MIIILKVHTSAADITSIIERVEEMGFETHLSQGEERTIIGLIGDKRDFDPTRLSSLKQVERVIPVMQPFKLASKTMHPRSSTVGLNGSIIGGNKLALIAGPCAVESESQLTETAHAVKEAGATALRAMLFKPRSSPYSFQGLGSEGIEILQRARAETGLPIVSEVLAIEHIELLDPVVDMLQLGARNMQNFALLKAAGASGKPILLKRGMSATINEWLMAAEYILAQGNPHVVLCERGIRTFETSTRNTTDISAIPVVKSLSHLPIILDPSHSTGKTEYVNAVARAAIAAGADGLTIEVHPNPAEALSDGMQSLTPRDFFDLVKEIRTIAVAVGRKF